MPLLNFGNVNPNGNNALADYVAASAQAIAAYIGIIKKANEFNTGPPIIP